MVLIDMSLVDEWALVKSYLNADLYTMKILEFLFATDQIKTSSKFLSFFLLHVPYY